MPLAAAEKGRFGASRCPDNRDEAALASALWDREKRGE